METKTKFDKKEYMKLYNKSSMAKLAQKKWYQSPKGKAKHKEGQKKYQFKYCGVYGAKDTQTGTWLYIGGSKSINSRINNHRHAAKNLSQALKNRPTQYELYSNLNKHPHQWEIVCQCDKDKVKSTEQHYITTLQPLYNKYQKKS